jgi:hypothetical protein
MGGIEKLCESPRWDVAALDHLSLTGLQPCFEDMGLYGTVCLGFIIMSSIRLWELRGRAEEVLFTRRQNAWFVLRAALLLVQVILPAILLSKTLAVEGYAAFEIIFLPLRIAAWLLVLCVLVRERRRPTPRSLLRFLLRILFLWALVVDTIRWTSQKALSETPTLTDSHGLQYDMAYVFPFFLAGWVPIALLCAASYFLPLSEDSGTLPQDFGQEPGNDNTVVVIVKIIIIIIVVLGSVAFREGEPSKEGCE